MGGLLQRRGSYRALQYLIWRHWDEERGCFMARNLTSNNEQWNGFWRQDIASELASVDTWYTDMDTGSSKNINQHLKWNLHKRRGPAVALNDQEKGAEIVCHSFLWWFHFQGIPINGAVGWYYATLLFYFSFWDFLLVFLDFFGIFLGLYDFFWDFFLL